MNEPVLGKAHPHVKDYQPILWSEFLILRREAQKTADSIGFPVYLVGSALQKDVPRDIDVSVIMPLIVYQRRYGKLPEKQDEYGAYLCRVQHRAHKHISNLIFCLYFQHHLDVKVCPDTWWPEKPKMLLAAPNAGRKDEP